MLPLNIIFGAKSFSLLYFYLVWLVILPCAHKGICWSLTRPASTFINSIGIYELLESIEIYEQNRFCFCFIKIIKIVKI